MRENGKSYQASYGLLRILACFSVIFHHFIAANQQYVSTLDEQWLIVGVDNLLMCNNSLFFMLSGKFALEYYDGRMGHFYKNKLLKIVLPFFLVSVYFYVWGGIVPEGSRSLRGFAEAFMGSEILGYLWFVYSLIGFYLVVPFLAPMMKALNLKEKRWFILLLVILIFVRNLCRIFGIPFVLSDFPFYHSAYILLGYLIEQSEPDKRMEYFIYGLSVPAMVVSCYFAICKPGVNPDIHDCCVSRLIMCAAIYLAVTRRSTLFAQKLKKPIKWIGDQTYYVYLIHILAQGFFLRYCWELWVVFIKLPFLLALFLGSVCIFVLALLLAWICRKIMSFLHLA